MQESAKPGGPGAAKDSAAAGTSRLPIALIRQAVEIYLRLAYPGKCIPEELPECVRKRLPPPTDNLQAWLDGDSVERDFDSLPADGVRSYAIRLGNETYPNMKLRLSRPPGESCYLLTVDVHDSALSAKFGTADFEALAELKRRNATLAAAITADLTSAGLPTERSYLREKIRLARRRNAESSDGSAADFD